jgi:beta-lactamase regulating signal transducer with metallopeptidase domain
MIIPQIDIPIKSNLPINNTLERITFTTGQLIQGEAIVENSPQVFTFQFILIALFIIISSIVLIRFILNILRILNKILKCKKVDYSKTSLVLVEEKTLPYSFFKYIFVNQADYENGKIEKELLIHEEAHCLQYHSIDIIIIELLNIFLWFNPAIWLFRKSILLNHEYYADNKVLIYRDPIDYQQLLLNILLRNNSNYLVSNFKYSFIKSRINMMTISNPLHKSILRKFSAISIFLVMAITMTFSQEIEKVNVPETIQNKWWFPVIQKHNIDLKQYTFMGDSNPVSSDTSYFYSLELGYDAKLDDGNFTLKDPVFIFKENEEVYNLVVAEFASHHLGTKEYTWLNGKLEDYKFDSKDIKPTHSISFDELSIDMKTHIATIKNIIKDRVVN